MNEKKNFSLPILIVFGLVGALVGTVKGACILSVVYCVVCWVIAGCPLYIPSRSARPLRFRFLRGWHEVECSRFYIHSYQRGSKDETCDKR